MSTNTPGKNFVCLTGLPGAGKTTLCERLIETGDFQYFCRDQEMERIEAEYDEEGMGVLHDRFGDMLNPNGGYSTFSQYIDGYTLQIPNNVGYGKEVYTRMNAEFNSLGEKIKGVVPIFLGYVKEVKAFIDEVSFPNISDSFEQFRSWLDFLIKREDKPIEFFKFTIREDLRRYLVSQLAIKRTVERAVEYYSSGDKNVLLDNHSLFLRLARDFWRKFLAEKMEIDPALLVLQASQQTLLDVAWERGGVDGPWVTEMMRLIRAAQTIEPDEWQAWKGLIIPVERTVASDVSIVRSMIATKVAEVYDEGQAVEVGYTLGQN